MTEKRNKLCWFCQIVGCQSGVVNQVNGPSSHRITGFHSKPSCRLLLSSQDPSWGREKLLGGQANPGNARNLRVSVPLPLPQMFLMRLSVRINRQRLEMFVGWAPAQDCYFIVQQVVTMDKQDDDDDNDDTVSIIYWAYDDNYRYGFFSLFVKIVNKNLKKWKLVN